MESHKERSYPCRAQTKLFLVRLCLACESCILAAGLRGGGAGHVNQGEESAREPLQRAPVKTTRLPQVALSPLHRVIDQLIGGVIG